MRNENGRPALARETARDETLDQQSLQETAPPKFTRARRAAGAFRAARRLIHDARRALRWQQETATSDESRNEAVAVRSALGQAAGYLLAREKKARREAWK